MLQVVPGVWTVVGLGVGRVYLLEGSDGVTLIDTSIASASKGIVRQLLAAGRRPSEVKRILITHAHPDHIGALPELQRLTNAQVLASLIEQPVVEGRTPIPHPPDSELGGFARYFRPGETRMPGTPVNRVLNEGDWLPEVLGGVQVLLVPGHAMGHLAFWQPERRILFCGDVVANMLGLSLPFAFFTVSMAENIRSVARLATLRPEVICFGHGPPLVQNAAARLEAFAQKVQRSGHP